LEVLCKQIDFEITLKEVRSLLAGKRNVRLSGRAGLGHSPAEAMEFLLVNSEDVTPTENMRYEDMIPLAPVRHQALTGTLIRMP
jgi:hypothetical protein